MRSGAWPAYPAFSYAPIWAFSSQSSPSFMRAYASLRLALAAAHGLDFRSGEDDAGLHAVFQEVIVAGGPVDGSVPFTAGDGVALHVLGLVRLSLMSGLAGHGSFLLRSAKFLCYHSANLVTKVVLGTDQIRCIIWHSETSIISGYSQRLFLYQPPEKKGVGRSGT